MQINPVHVMCEITSTHLVSLPRPKSVSLDNTYITYSETQLNHCQTLVCRFKENMKAAQPSNHMKLCSSEEEPEA